MEKSKLKIKAPTWDLTDFYDSYTDLRIQKDLSKAKKETLAFQKKYIGTLKKLSAEDLAVAIQSYQDVSECLSYVSSYASLLFAADMEHKDHGTFYQNTCETISTISQNLIFFTLELNQIDPKALEKGYEKSSALKHFQPWIGKIQRVKTHQLDEQTERLFHEMSLPASSNWVRLYDETFARLRFQYKGQDLTVSDILNKGLDEDEVVRKESHAAFGSVLKHNAPLFTLILNTIAKEKQISDKWHHYQAPVSSRNMENNVEDAVVHTLIKTVTQNYNKTSHRFYQLKADWLGKKRLDYWDRNAPLPSEQSKTYSWDEARDIVLKAYQNFSPEMAKIGTQFFEKNWIDAALRPGKDSGAFSHPTVPSAHPYILQNFHGKIWDVMTLAHELGHGIHQVLAAKQGYLMADTPLTLAETASIFGEMLTFKSLLNQVQTKAERRSLLAGKINDMLNTIIRQISFSAFEHKIHDLRQTRELSTDDICAIWMETQQDSLGPAVNLGGNYAYYWSYISHFFHVPFYVYAYAFGNCLVNALYTEFQKVPNGFQTKYIQMLEAGGTLHHKDLLKPFNLDTTSPSFWQKGLNLLIEMIDELEALS